MGIPIFEQKKICWIWPQSLAHDAHIPHAIKVHRRCNPSQTWNQTFNFQPFVWWVSVYKLTSDWWFDAQSWCQILIVCPIFLHISRETSPDVMKDSWEVVHRVHNVMWKHAALTNKAACPQVFHLLIQLRLSCEILRQGNLDFLSNTSSQQKKLFKTQSEAMALEHQTWDVYMQPCTMECQQTCSG